MKNKIKKWLSLLLTLVITLSWVGISYVRADSDYINGGSLGNHPEGLFAEGIYATMEKNDAPYSGWSIEYAPTTEDAYYVIRGDETINIGMPGRGTLIKYSDTEYFLRLSAWSTNNFAYTTGDIFVIDGYWKQNTGGNAVIKIAKTYLYYNGTTWIFSTNTPSDEPAQPSVISGGVMQSHINSHAPYGIYFAMAENDAPYKTDWTSEYTQTSADNIKLIRDGRTFSIGLEGRPLVVKYGQTDYYLKLEGWNVGEYGLNGQSNPITTADILVVEGDFQYEGTTLNITKSYVYFNGTAWICSANKPSDEPAQPSVISGGVMQSHVNSHAPYGIYFAMAENDAPYKTDWTSEYTQTSADNIKLIRDGQTFSIGLEGRPLVVKYGQTDYYLKLEGWNVGEYGLNGQSNPITTADILVVEGDFQYEGTTLNITKSYVYFNGTAWICSANEPSAPPEQPAPETIPVGPLGNHGNGVFGEGIYATMAENDAPFRTDWMLEYAPVTADAYYVIRGGERINIGMPGRGTLIKYSETEYFLRISAWCTENFAYTPDDILVIGGLWKENNGTATLQMETTYLYHDGYGWNFSARLPLETVADTTGNLTTTLTPKSSQSLGEISEDALGFTFDLNRPQVETTGILQLSLFHDPQQKDASTGYTLLVQNDTEKNTLQWELSCGDEEAQTTQFHPDGDLLRVHSWHQGGMLYVAVNEQLIFCQPAGKHLGLSMNAVNGWSEDALFSGKITKEPLPEDTSIHVRFEDLAVTTVQESKYCPSAQSANFGNVSNTWTGFSLILNTLNIHQPNVPVKIGFYNTGVSNPWMDGYLVAIRIQQDGRYTFHLYQGKGEVPIKNIANVKISEKRIRLDAWLTDGNTFHLKVNGKEILTHTDENYAVALGTYMSAYNDRAETIGFYTVWGIVDTSKDVNFMDLGQTMRLNSIPILTKLATGLGRLSSSKSGFQFRITRPPVSDAGQDTKIGIYNMEKKNPWTDGYLLVLTPRANGDMGVSLRTGNSKGEFVLTIQEDLKGLTEEYLTIRTWISNVNGMNHIFHVSINGKEVIAYRNNDGSPKLGTYVSIYQNGTPLEVQTIQEIMELSDLYLERYGDPTAMGESLLPETAPVELPTVPAVPLEEPQTDLQPVVILSAGTLAVVALAIIPILLAKGKKHIEKGL